MCIRDRLPTDISNKLFRYFRHPAAELVRLYYRSPKINNLLEDIRDYPESKKQLYSLSFSKNHEGIWGRATLLNSLWTEARLNCGTYYKIWERMYRIKILKNAEYWIRWRYAVNSHKFQINSLWALFTCAERKKYLKRYINYELLHYPSPIIIQFLN